jgi:hypothetical protein
MGWIKPQSIMKIKLFIASALCVLGLFITSCQQQQTPAEPSATTYNFNLTFDPGETFESYSGITGFDNNDVVLVYIRYEVLGSDGFWTLLPWMSESDGVYIVPEFSESTGLLFINTTWANGNSGSPWSSSITFYFKAVLIKSKSLLQDVDYTNYEEVKEAYKL